MFTGAAVREKQTPGCGRVICWLALPTPPRRNKRYGAYVRRTSMCTDDEGRDAAALWSRLSAACVREGPSVQTCERCVEVRLCTDVCTMCERSVSLCTDMCMLCEVRLCSDLCWVWRPTATNHILIIYLFWESERCLVLLAGSSASNGSLVRDIVRPNADKTR